MPAKQEVQESRCRRNQAAYVLVNLPSNLDTLRISVKPKQSYGEIFTEVCEQIGLEEKHHFTLAKYGPEGSISELIDNESIISRCYYKSTAKSCKCHKDDDNVHVIKFAVKYYCKSISEVRSERARQLYYHQIKENYLNLSVQYPAEPCFLLSSYSIHWEIESSLSSFDPRSFFPAWMVEKYGNRYICKHMPSIKPKEPRISAREMFITEASIRSPLPLTSYIYKIDRVKGKPGETRLCIGIDGIILLELDANTLILKDQKLYSWSTITEITQNKFKLGIQLSDRKNGLELMTHSPLHTRNIRKMLNQCQSYYHHKYHIVNDLKGFNESYIYSDHYDLEWETEMSIMGTQPRPTYPHRATESDTSAIFSRMSVVSMTSSTTTSGINCSNQTIAEHSAALSESREDFPINYSFDTSCDSLLEPSKSSTPETRIVTVQRATSAPNHTIGELRLNKPMKVLPRRALSNEEFPDHTYENVAEVHEMLALLPRRKMPTPSLGKQQLRPVVSRSFDYFKSEGRPVIKSSSPTQRYSFVYGMTTEKLLGSSLSPITAQPAQRTVSAEKLLLDYAPPPSYNQNHARQGEIILARIRRQSLIETNNNLIPEPQYKACASSCSDLLDMSVKSADLFPVRPAKTKRTRTAASKSHDSTFLKASQPPQLAAEPIKPRGCKCQGLSHPEIDKIRELQGSETALPLITALCNDKELLKQSLCMCDATPTPSPRPMSWHCDGGVFQFPATNQTAIKTVV